MLATALVLATPTGAQRAPVCGVDRWPVKVLIDDDTGRVNLTPRPTTVAFLARLPKPSGERANRSRLPLEQHTFRVRGILVGHHVSDDDSDIHIIIADPTTTSVTMVAEIPDPACALGSRHRTEYAMARQAIARIRPGAEIEIEGVAFWDRPHGQSGMAPNAIELHPVLRITPVDQLNEFAPGLAPKEPSSPADSSTVRVWLNTSSRIYHCLGSSWYGRTARGEYLTEAEARGRGARPAGGRPCR